MPSPEPDATTPGFTIKADTEPRVVVTGELDLLTSPQLQERLDVLIDDKATERLVIDLSGVTFFDSSALNVLLQAQGRAGERKVSLAIVPSDAVSRVIDLTGVGEHLTVVQEPPAS